MVHKPKITSQFLGDRTKDQSFLCALKFHKFMRCNEKSPVKINEANIYNGTFNEYKCFEELEELLSDEFDSSELVYLTKKELIKIIISTAKFYKYEQD
jgi:hypothetical protein